MTVSMSGLGVTLQLLLDDCPSNDRISTKPKVTGSNPVGRAPLSACLCRFGQTPDDFSFAKLPKGRRLKSMPQGSIASGGVDDGDSSAARKLHALQNGGPRGSSRDCRRARRILSRV